jgi:aspartyl protease family protein
MKQTDWLSMIAVSGVIAAAVAVFVAPKLDEPAPQPAQKTPIAASVQVEEPLAANAAVISRKDDGHYWTRADVDDTAVNFMVDTGASTVALTFRDAQRIGLKPETLDYRWEIRTAGGITHGASVLLEEIKIGRVSVENVEAMILRDGLDQSLLGMTFLGELNSYEFKKKQLIIRK